MSNGMSVDMSTLVACATAFAGFAALCLATDRHGAQAFSFKVEPGWFAAAQKALLWAGLGGQLVSAALCIARAGALGLVSYFGLALLTALCMVGLAAWAPRAMPKALSLALCVAAAGLWLA